MNKIREECGGTEEQNIQDFKLNLLQLQSRVLNEEPSLNQQQDKSVVLGDILTVNQ